MNKVKVINSDISLFLLADLRKSGALALLRNKSVKDAFLITNEQLVQHDQSEVDFLFRKIRSKVMPTEKFTFTMRGVIVQKIKEQL